MTKAPTPVNYTERPDGKVELAIDDPRLKDLSAVILRENTFTVLHDALADRGLAENVMLDAGRIIVTLTPMGKLPKYRSMIIALITDILHKASLIEDRRRAEEAEDDAEIARLVPLPDRR